MPKKGFSIPKLHPRAKEAIGLLKKHSSGTKAIFRQRAQILHDFYSNEDTSPSYVTVHVFIYSQTNEKRSSKKLIVNIPSKVASQLPYGLQIRYGSPMYLSLATLVSHAANNPFSVMKEFVDIYGEPDHFVLSNKGTVPKATVNDLAEEPVADGTQPLPQHAFLDPAILVQTKCQDCLPFYLVQSLKESWDKVFIKEKLTQNTILKFLNRTSPVMSANDVRPFLEKYRLHLRILDLNNRTIFEYDPPIRHKKLKSSFTFLHHNAHVTPLNYNLKALCQKEFEDESTLPFMDFKREMTEIMSELELLAALKILKPQTLYYRTQSSAEDLFKLFLSQGIEPKIRIDKHNIPTAFVIHNPHKITVQISEIALKTYTLLRDAFLQPQYKSSYSESAKRAFNDLKRGHVKRHFIDSDQLKPSIDMIRGYSARCKEVDFFPVFHKTDSFEQFQAPIEPYTLYIVANDDFGDPERFLICNQSHNLVSGLVLESSKLQFKIVAQLRPSKVEPNTIRDTLKDLYESNAPDLKLAFNLNCGMASKLSHIKSEAIYTTSINEAEMFGDVMNFHEGYLATRHSEKEEFNEGYFGIGFMVYDLQRLRLLEVYRDLAYLMSTEGSSSSGSCGICTVTPRFRLTASFASWSLAPA